MNFITRMALSLSLIALIAQPIQAATSIADTVKKSTRILMHTAQTAAGAYLAWNALGAYLSFKKYAIKRPVDKNGKRELQFWEEYAFHGLEGKPNKFTPMAIISTIGILTFLSRGLSGLRREICLHFNPLASYTKKIPQQMLQTAELALNAAQIATVYIMFGGDNKRLLPPTSFAGIKRAYNESINCNGAEYHRKIGANLDRPGFEFLDCDIVPGIGDISIGLKIFTSATLLYYGIKGPAQVIYSKLQREKTEPSEKTA